MGAWQPDGSNATCLLAGHGLVDICMDVVKHLVAKECGVERGVGLASCTVVRIDPAWLGIHDLGSRRGHRQLFIPEKEVGR